MTTIKILKQIIWATTYGAKAEWLGENEIVISHPKSSDDFPFDIRKEKDREYANKVIVNWVNSIFPDLEDEDKIEYP